MKKLTYQEGQPWAQVYRDEEGNLYKGPDAAFLVGPDKHYYCHCGNDQLWIIASDDYETSGKCPQCRFEAVVHSG